MIGNPLKSLTIKIGALLKQPLKKRTFQMMFVRTATCSLLFSLKKGLKKGLQKKTIGTPIIPTFPYMFPLDSPLESLKKAF